MFVVFCVSQYWLCCVLVCGVFRVCVCVLCLLVCCVVVVCLFVVSVAVCLYVCMFIVW